MASQNTSQAPPTPPGEPSDPLAASQDFRIAQSCEQNHPQTPSGLGSSQNRDGSQSNLPTLRDLFTSKTTANEQGLDPVDASHSNSTAPDECSPKRLQLKRSLISASSDTESSHNPGDVGQLKRQRCTSGPGISQSKSSANLIQPTSRDVSEVDSAAVDDFKNQLRVLEKENARRLREHCSQVNLDPPSRSDAGSLSSGPQISKKDYKEHEGHQHGENLVSLIPEDITSKLRTEMRKYTIPRENVNSATS